MGLSGAGGLKGAAEVTAPVEIEGVGGVPPNDVAEPGIVVCDCLDVATSVE